METTDIYITELGDSWDNISYKVYGNEKYMVELMKANSKYIDKIIFPANVILYCPDITPPEDDYLPPWKRG